MVKLLLSLLGVCLATTPMMEVAEVEGYRYILVIRNGIHFAV